GHLILDVLRGEIGQAELFFEELTGFRGRAGYLGSRLLRVLVLPAVIPDGDHEKDERDENDHDEITHKSFAINFIQHSLMSNARDYGFRAKFAKEAKSAKWKRIASSADSLDSNTDLLARIRLPMPP